MRLLDYIKWQLDEAIKMCFDPNTSKDQIAIFLMEFQKGLFPPEKVIVDEDKTKYLTMKENDNHVETD